MPDKVRVGVAGTSWYADIAHLPWIKSHPPWSSLRFAGATEAAPRKWRTSMASP